MIYKRDSRVDEQNADLTILAYLSFNATFTFMNWTRAWRARSLETSERECNAPILADTETSLQRIYASQKYLHVYTLSISTDKNQSTEASGALYIPTHEYIYKVITRSDPILHEYYITDAQMREYKRYTYMNSRNTRKCTSMNSIKGTHEFTKGNSSCTQGPGRMKLQIVCRRSTL